MGLLINRSTKLPIQTLLLFFGVPGLGSGEGASTILAGGAGASMGSVCTSNSLTETGLCGLSLQESSSFVDQCQHGLQNIKILFPNPKAQHA